jgi:hypothetical protein
MLYLKVRKFSSFFYLLAKHYERKKPFFDLRIEVSENEKFSDNLILIVAENYFLNHDHPIAFSIVPNYGTVHFPSFLSFAFRAL